jgi:hypothetical protein
MQINSRRINDELNVVKGLHKSPIFLGVLAVTAGLQVRVGAVQWSQGVLARGAFRASNPSSALSLPTHKHITHPNTHTTLC